MQAFFLTIVFLLMFGVAMAATPGDTFNCNGGHWLVTDEVAKCMAGGGTVPGGTVPYPTPIYTLEPLIGDCRPIERQTPTPSSYLYVPMIQNGDE